MSGFGFGAGVLLAIVVFSLIAGLIFLLIFGIVRLCKRKKVRRQEESGDDSRY